VQCGKILQLISDGGDCGSTNLESYRLACIYKDVIREVFLQFEPLAIIRILRWTLCVV